MATTKKSTNKSGKSGSSAKNTRKKKNSSDDTMKFLLVLVIAGIAIALIFFSQNCITKVFILKKDNLTFFPLFVYKNSK